MTIPETFFTVNEELRLFGFSCVLGAVLGAAYDVLRALRLVIKHNAVLTAIEDTAFLVFCGIGLVAFTEIFARSEMRLYFAIGSAIGFTLYFVTAGSIIMKTLRKLFTVFGSVFRLILRPLRTPFIILHTKAAMKFVGISKIAVKPVKKLKIGLINTQSVLYNKMENKKRKNVKSVVEKNEA